MDDASEVLSVICCCFLNCAYILQVQSDEIVADDDSHQRVNLHEFLTVRRVKSGDGNNNDRYRRIVMLDYRYVVIISRTRARPGRDHDRGSGRWRASALGVRWDDKDVKCKQQQRWLIGSCTKYCNFHLCIIYRIFMVVCVYS